MPDIVLPDTDAVNCIVTSAPSQVVEASNDAVEPETEPVSGTLDTVQPVFVTVIVPLNIVPDCVREADSLPVLPSLELVHVPCQSPEKSASAMPHKLSITTKTSAKRIAFL